MKLYRALCLVAALLGSAVWTQTAQAAEDPALDSATASAVVEQTINLNQATSAELQLLKGVGPKTAEAIIAWREQEGPFQDVEQLLSIKGIGEKTLQAIRDRLTL